MRTTIDINNYEAYLLDHLEGNLSPADTEALMAFLDQHPDLKAEVEGLQLPYLEPDETIIYPNKALLKKSTGGRVVAMGGRTRWYYAAAAAAIIAGVVLIWTMLPQTPTQQAIEGLADQPHITVPVDSNAVNTEPQSTDSEASPAPTPQEQQAPSLPPLRLNQPTQGNTEQIAQHNDMPSLSPLQKTKIESVDLMRHQFQSDAIAVYDPVQPREFTPEAQPSPLQEQGNRLWNTILSNEVARNFIPEVVEEDVPDPDQIEKRDRDNTIILEVPKKGKQLLDNILNR